MKICSKCKLEYSEDQFFKQKAARDGFSSWCKNCSREYGRSEAGKKCRHKKEYIESRRLYNLNYRQTETFKKYNRKYLKTPYRSEMGKKFDKIKNLSKYGLTLTEYDKLLSTLNNRCAICKKELIKPCVDHCHKTLKVRGILCIQCNFLLEYAHDNIQVLKNAINYLENFQDSNNNLSPRDKGKEVEVEENQENKDN